MPDVLFVAGNHAKSIFSFYLASQLSLLGKAVVISTDSYQSVSQTLFFQKDGIDDKSLGKLLSYPILSKQRLFEHLIVLDDNLAYLGYAANENSLYYPDILLDNVNDLICELSFANWIIVDSSRELNTLDKLLLPKANKQFLLYSANRKGIAYRRQLLPEMTQPIKIAIQDSAYNPIADIPCDYSIPYTKLLEPVGNIVDLRSISIPKGYSRVLKKIQKEVL